jgi:aminopeptidase N
MAADSYPRQQAIDAQHYTFRVTLRDDTDEISGEATVALRFVKESVAQVELDLTSIQSGKGIDVTGVTENGTALEYRHQADRLAVKLSAAPKAGETRAFTIRYHGLPGNGLRIVKNRFGERCFFSVNWPVMARQWLPMIDHPYDKATSEFLVTAPAKYQVVANGALEEEIDLGDGRRLTHWKQSAPIASWLNNIGVAQFAVRHFGAVAGIPLQTWVFPKDRENGIITFENPTRQAIEFFIDRFGPYPYAKLADVQMAGMSGGMEHASAIFFGEGVVSSKPAFNLVAHEISHQWFGDSVTENDWDDAWLSEGFATYCALLATEHYQGRAAFIAGLKRSRAMVLTAEKRGGTLPVIHDNLAEISNGKAPNVLVYQKGAWTLHMLRGQIGTEKFWAGMREYYRRFRDGNASTEDFRKVMEEVSKTDLGWFFDQWLRRAGVPVIEAWWSYNQAAKRVELELIQTQSGAPFRLPVEVSAGGKVIKLDLTEQRQRFEIPAASPPANIEFDPNTRLLADVTLRKR